MEITIELCPKDEWDSMVEIFTEMEEHYYQRVVCLPKREK
jgi:hypothetical protein